jgi:anti-sigma regulatory factor (Ser/Thr protein kinase)
MRSPNSADAACDCLTVKADISSLDSLQRFAATCLTRFGGPVTLLSKIELVLEELLVNVFDYAYPGDTSGQVTLHCLVQEGKLLFVIKDQGVAFDPLASESVDTSLDIDQRRIGGLGIYLVRNMVDSIFYERQDGSNVLTVAFSLSE